MSRGYSIVKPNTLVEMKFHPSQIAVGDLVYRLGYLENGLWTVRSIQEYNGDNDIVDVLNHNGRHDYAAYRSRFIHKSIVDAMEVGRVLLVHNLRYVIESVDFSSGYINISNVEGGGIARLDYDHISGGIELLQESIELVECQANPMLVRTIPKNRCTKYKDKWVLTSDMYCTETERDEVPSHAWRFDREYIQLYHCNILVLRDELDDLEYTEATAGRAEGHAIPVDDSIYVEDSGNTYHSDDQGNYFRWSDRFDQYIEGCDNDSDRHGYHDGPRHDYSDGATYRFGVEVEKEDYDVLSSHTLSDCDDTGWSREEDSSLDSESGYEFVSPMFDLFGDKFDESLADGVVADHVNGDYSTSCGGHMSFSIRGHDGLETYNRVKGFVPLILSLYKGRLRNSYSTAYKDPVGRGRGAINVANGYVEFRVFAAVRNVQNLKNRRDLLRVMANNLDRSPLYFIRMAMDESSELHQILRRAYDRDKLYDRIALCAGIAEEMTGKNYMRFVTCVDKDQRATAKRSAQSLIQE